MITKAKQSLGGSKPTRQPEFLKANDEETITGAADRYRGLL